MSKLWISIPLANSNGVTLHSGGAVQVTADISFWACKEVRIEFFYDGRHEMKTFYINHLSSTGSSELYHTSFVTNNANDGYPRIFLIDFKMDGRYLTDILIKHSRDLGPFSEYTGSGVSISKVVGILK